jgi:hypothetical protein
MDAVSTSNVGMRSLYLKIVDRMAGRFRGQVSGPEFVPQKSGRLIKARCHPKSAIGAKENLCPLDETR